MIINKIIFFILFIFLSVNTANAVYFNTSDTLTKSTYGESYVIGGSVTTSSTVYPYLGNLVVDLGNVKKVYQLQAPDFFLDAQAKTAFESKQKRITFGTAGIYYYQGWATFTKRDLTNTYQLTLNFDTFNMSALNSRSDAPILFPLDNINHAVSYNGINSGANWSAEFNSASQTIVYSGDIWTYHPHTIYIGLNAALDSNFIRYRGLKPQYATYYQVWSNTYTSSANIQEENTATINLEVLKASNSRWQINRTDGIPLYNGTMTGFPINTSFFTSKGAMAYVYDNTNILFRTINLFTGGWEAGVGDELVGAGGVNSIKWDAKEYLQGDTGSYSWTANQTSWNEKYLGIGYEYRAELYKNDILEKSVPLSSISGTYLHSMIDIGDYRVDLVRYWNAKYYLGLGGTILATNSVTVRAIGEIYLFAPSNTIQGVPYNITYSLPLGINNANIVDKWGDMGLASRKIYSVPTPYTTTRKNMTIYPHVLGKHILQLEATTTDIRYISATINFYVNEATKPPPLSTFTTLVTDSVNYSVGDNVQARYSINSSHLATYNYFDILISSAAGVPLGYKYFISTPSGLETIEIESYIEGAQTGSAFVNLSGRGQTFGTTLASVPINILPSINLAGYSITAVPQKVGNNEKIKVTYITPSQGILEVLYVSPAQTTKTLNYTVGASGTKLFTFSKDQIRDRSSIEFDLYDISKVLQVSTSVVFDTRVIVTPTPEITPVVTPTLTPFSPEEAISFYNDKIFYGFILLAAGIAAIGGGMYGVVVGVLIIVPILCLMGLFPLWVLFLEVAVVLFTLVVVLSGSLTKTGGSD